MAEDKELCRRFQYHRHKLILVLSAMRSHRDSMKSSYHIRYYEISDSRPYFEKLKEAVHQIDAKSLQAYEADSFERSDMLKTFAKKLGLPLSFIRSPKFLLDHDYAVSLLNRERPRMQTFYIHQRKRFDILLNEKGLPDGGKWSYDTENRNPFPKQIVFPDLDKIPRTSHTEKVSSIIDLSFPENPGDSALFFLPTTRSDALTWMHSFFHERYPLFGPYEDAIHSNQVFGFHSVLSPLLNIGLITPKEVIEEALKHDAPIASKEGFIRQILGWREFIRGIYFTRQFHGNYFNSRNELGRAWYNASTGIPILDDSIRKVLRYGYVHHIERLMIIGNLMLLCEINPDHVYRWFSELFIDADDWVMVPNIYGMSQYADGGGFATKPYIASSRYLLKMSNYPRGDWCEIVDGLYWRFISRHHDAFQKNPRSRMMSSWIDRMDPGRLKHLTEVAEQFIRRIRNNR